MWIKVLENLKQNWIHLFGDYEEAKLAALWFQKSHLCSGLRISKAQRECWRRGMPAHTFRLSSCDLQPGDAHQDIRNSRETPIQGHSTSFNRTVSLKSDFPRLTVIQKAVQPGFWDEGLTHGGLCLGVGIQENLFLRCVLSGVLRARYRKDTLSAYQNPALLLEGDAQNELVIPFMNLAPLLQQ